MVGFCNENGNVTYSEEVLAKIVGLSTMECYGVVGMVSKKSYRRSLGANGKRELKQRRKISSNR